MAGTNEILSVENQLVGMPLAGPESFSQQQLAYLKQALGLDETVLYSSASGSTSMQLSESILNFERIRFKVVTDQGFTYIERQISSGTNLVLGWVEGLGNAWWTAMLLTYTAATTTLSVNHLKMVATSFANASTTLSAQADPSSQMNAIREIVGIHRIAGGN